MLNWNMVGPKTVIRCSSKEEAEELYTEASLRFPNKRMSKELFVAWFRSHPDTCFNLRTEKEDGVTSYCYEGYYKRNGYDIVRYTALKTRGDLGEINAAESIEFLFGVEEAVLC